MTSAPDMLLIQNFLQFLGVFVSFSIAYVSLRGVRQTESSTLLRLATAFAFLGLGFLIQGVMGLGIPSLRLTAITSTAVVITGLLLETTGYFFLAFSHAVDVLISKRMGVALMFFPVVSLTTIQFVDVLSILSFYFVLYGVVETTYSYLRSKKPDTLIIALGLSLIGAGTFTQWLSLLYSNVEVLSLLQIITKEMGLVTLLIPVLGFAKKATGVKLGGPV